VPVFLSNFLELLEEKLNESGLPDICGFLNTQGKQIAVEMLKEYSYVPPYSENKDFYIDWGKDEEFSLAGLGPGECGAGVLDMIEADLTEANILLEEAEKKGYLPEEIKKALFLSARALLVVKGSDPKDYYEAFTQFKEKFIKEGISTEIYSDIDVVFESINEKLELTQRKEKLLYAKKFYEHIKQLYKNMDPSFTFPQIKGETKKIKGRYLDLTGTPCPLNYVKVKLALENLGSGDTIEVLLDEGEAMDNVPKSLENDGHHIINIKRINGSYKIVVKKK
jgi:sulfite reductase (ferredoxin)